MVNRTLLAASRMTTRSRRAKVDRKPPIPANQNQNQENVSTILTNEEKELINSACMKAENRRHNRGHIGSSPSCAESSQLVFPKVASSEKMAIPIQKHVVNSIIDDNDVVISSRNDLFSMSPVNESTSQLRSVNVSSSTSTKTTGRKIGSDIIQFQKDAISQDIRNTMTASRISRNHEIKVSFEKQNDSMMAPMYQPGRKRVIKILSDTAEVRNGTLVEKAEINHQMEKEMQKLFAASHFKDYLISKKSRIPKVLDDINCDEYQSKYSTASMPAIAC